MNGTTTLARDIKQMMAENLMLQIIADEIGDEQALFGPGSLGLDSVDAHLNPSFLQPNCN